MKLLKDLQKTENFFVVSVLSYNCVGISNFSGYSLLQTLSNAFDYLVN